MAGDSATEVRKALVALLVADAPVAAITGDRVYDRSEEGDTFPLITFGDEFADPYDALALDGAEVNVTIHGWTDEDGHTVVARSLKAAMVNALHRADLTVQGHDLVFCRVTGSRVMRGEDQRRYGHAVVTVRVITN